MGIIFSRKSDYGAIIDKKRVNKKRFGKKNRAKIAKEMGFTTVKAKNAFIKGLAEKQKGGLTRDEAHDIFQNLIKEGKITKKNAMKMAKNLDY